MEKNEYFNKFYEYDNMLKTPIFNIIGIYFCNIPSNKNTTICGHHGSITSRSTITFEVINKTPKFIYKKAGKGYVAYDEKMGVYSYLKESKKGYKDEINVIGEGKIFPKLGVSKKKARFERLGVNDILRDFGVKTILVGLKKRNEDFASQTVRYLKKEIVDLKLLQAGINILDYQYDVEL